MRILVLFFYLIALPNCTSVKVHNRTKMFIDIEVPIKDAWVGCSDMGLEEEKSLMTFYVLDNSNVHEFIFRRVLGSERCLSIEKSYRKLMDSESTIRLVGIHPIKSSGRLITERVPKRFKESRHEMINWTFIRLSNLKDCESYFKGDCKPENYWGGISPP